MHRKEFPSFRNNLATGATFIYVEKHWLFVPYKRRVTNFKEVIKDFAEHRGAAICFEIFFRYRTLKVVPIRVSAHKLTSKTSHT